MSEKPKISKETCINYRDKLDLVFKNQVYNMARGEKLKGQLNENFLIGQLYMCKRVGDNQRRKCKRARGQNLKGGYNENLVSGSFPGRKLLTWTRVTLVSKNGTHQFQIKGKGIDSIKCQWLGYCLCAESTYHRIQKKVRS
jgi:hypothetical protein